MVPASGILLGLALLILGGEGEFSTVSCGHLGSPIAPLCVNDPEYDLLVVVVGLALFFIGSTKLLADVRRKQD